VGREARCTASWGTRSGAVTVHLDATELTVRGAFRASAPLASLRDRAPTATRFVSARGPTRSR
jgi:hypothetical protein